MLLGDNLGDFQDVGGLTMEERTQLFQTHRAMWGTRWIVIPNPSYGSWETTLYDNDFSLTSRQKQERKLQALEVWQPDS